MSLCGRSGTTAATATSTPVATAGLHLVRPLSFGPAAEVWEARLKGRPVIARRHLSPTGDLPWPAPPDPVVLQELNHPGLARFLTSILDPEGMRIDLFAPIRGETLYQAVRRGPMPIGDWLPAMRSAAVGLRWMHARSPVSPRLHGDVAPANLVMAGHGRARWIDIGAMAPGTLPAGAGIVWGTLPMLAPEVLAGDSAGPPAEVHALALLALVAALGRVPWAAASSPTEVLAHPSRRDAAHLAVGLEAPPSVVELLVRMLAWDPADRPTMTQVVASWPRTKKARALDVPDD